MTSGVLKYGNGGSDSAKAAMANFAGAGLNGLSLCTTPIEVLSNDGKDTVLHTASGFFWLRKGRPYLVTNWHVASGRNPFTGELGQNALIPQKLRFYGTRIIFGQGQIRFERQGWTLEFDEGMVEQLATPPEIDGQVVDIWAAPIAPIAVFGKDPTRAGFPGAATMTCFVNEYTEKHIVTRAGDDCFILGYPLNNSDGLRPPIWKRGSIASDTNIGVDGRPLFLVDAAVTAAMSGSPIIRRAVTLVADNKDIGALQEFTSFQLIGVYAGRLQSSLLQATNLGYGWYRTLIDPVIDSYGYPPITPMPPKTSVG